MKKTVYLLLMMAFIFGACSKNGNNAEEPDVEEPVAEDPVVEDPKEEPNPLDFHDFPDFESYWEAWVYKYFGDLDWDLTPYSFLEDWDLTPYLNVCDAVTDAVVIDIQTLRDSLKSGEGLVGMDIWKINDDTVRSMSTCGLLETMIRNEGNYFGGFPFDHFKSDLRFPGIANFNSKLRTNKVAVEFFKREDCISVLVSKYLSLMPAAMIDVNSYLQRMIVVEMLISSDMFMSLLSEKEKILFMAMALERAKILFIEIGSDIDMYAVYLRGTYHIMIAVMKLYNYTPFMEKVWPKLRDWRNGYAFDPMEESLFSTGIIYAQIGIIIHYAKQFYQQTKTEIL